MCNSIDYKSIFTGLDVLNKIGINPIKVSEVCGIKLEQSFSDSGIVCEFYKDAREYLSNCIIYHYLDNEKKSLKEIINLDSDLIGNSVEELSDKLDTIMFSELDYFIDSNLDLINETVNKIQSILPRLRKVRINSSTSDETINQVYRFAKIIRIYSYESSNLGILGYCPNLVNPEISSEECDVEDFINSYSGVSFIDSGLELTEENSHLVELLIYKFLGGSSK